ncbi:hypothetical protein RCL_jg24596.t1 [Rhizophagus clarus]|uniref:Uncharacterized protein n=1 Tax=Rhizophagus clarus TaxID=94130 RepID=A0A8H3R5L5_9GLOM|nr:hypothetical protein RCL_jg24596.t1 [Rhizophagus clarus]
MRYIFAEEEDARDLSDEENDPGVQYQYVCHEEKYYDSLSADECEPDTLMYIVYGYWDYRKENSVIFHAAFDDEEEALKFAEEFGDGDAEYACTL